MASSAVVPSPYLPLGSDDTIRLLHVYRKGKAIVGLLERFCLSSANCPDFTTFSYVWGGPKYDERRRIVVGGVDVPVLDSVYPILELVCDDAQFAADVWLWIDSICINQSDVAERSAQVRQMGQIYRQSKRTVVWLGRATRDTDAAMDFLRAIIRETRDMEKVKVDLDLPGEVGRLPKPLQDRARWAQVERWLRNPWWKRVWTLQEFMQARRLTFHCGDRSIGRRDLHAAVLGIWVLGTSDDLIDEYSWRAAWNRRRLFIWHRVGGEAGIRHDMNLVALIAYVGDCRATDDRDRVYSLLGLANKTDQDMIGQPSYVDTVAVDDVAELYTQLVMAYVKTHSSLDIICFAHIFNGYGCTIGGKRPLPSWVPDWRTEVQSFVVPLMVSQSGNRTIGNFRPIKYSDPVPCLYMASGGTAPIVFLSQDSRQLTCRGIVLDSIDGLGSARSSGVALGLSGSELTRRGLIQSTSPTNLHKAPAESDSESDGALRLPRNLSRLVNDLVCSMVLGSEDRYLQNPAPMDRFRQEFVQLCNCSLRYPDEKVLMWFRSWYLANGALLVQGYTIEDVCRAVSKGISVEWAEFEKVDKSDTWLMSRMHDTKGSRRMARRLVTTLSGKIGIAPAQSQQGDVIAILYGCNVPVVLRRFGSSPDTYQFIGECYLHGYMKGEGLETGSDGTSQEVDITLV